MILFFNGWTSQSRKGRQRRLDEDQSSQLRPYSLFHGISAPFQACGARLSERCLLLLRCSCLLLVGGVGGGGILSPALPTRGSCTRGRTGTCVSADGLSDNRSPHGAARTCTRRSPRCGGRWFRRRCLRRWLGRIEAGLLHGPRVTGGFVALLLFRALSLGWVHELLRAGARNQHGAQGQTAQVSLRHFRFLSGG